MSADHDHPVRLFPSFPLGNDVSDRQFLDLKRLLRDFVAERFEPLGDEIGSGVQVGGVLVASWPDRQGQSAHECDEFCAHRSLFPLDCGHLHAPQPPGTNQHRCRNSDHDESSEDPTHRPAA